MRIRNSHPCKNLRLQGLHALGVGVILMIEAQEMQDTMHDEMHDMIAQIGRAHV